MGKSSWYKLIISKKKPKVIYSFQKHFCTITDNTLLKENHIDSEHFFQSSIFHMQLNSKRTAEPRKYFFGLKQRSGSLIFVSNSALCKKSQQFSSQGIKWCTFVRSCCRHRDMHGACFDVSALTHEPHWSEHREDDDFCVLFSFFCFVVTCFVL